MTLKSLEEMAHEGLVVVVCGFQSAHASFAALPCLESIGTQHGHRKTLGIQRIERY